MKNKKLLQYLNCFAWFVVCIIVMSEVAFPEHISNQSYLVYIAGFIATIALVIQALFLLDEKNKKPAPQR